MIKERHSESAAAEESSMAKDVAHESQSQLTTTPQLPVSTFVWRIFLVVAVFLYSSYTIFVHLCEKDGHLPFRTSAVVFLIELLKLFLSVVMFALGSDVFKSTNPVRRFAQAVRSEFRQYSHSDAHEKLLSSSTLPSPVPGASKTPLSWSQLIGLVLPFIVPAVLYAINNNLSMFIQLEMDPATYQVMGNFKILSTAILFRLIIKRPLTYLQWFSLVLLLFAGMTNSYGGLIAKSTPSTVQSKVTTDVPAGTMLHISLLGILMISVYCTISGLSGVYTEYVMKKRAKMSIHLQNAMLYIFGVILNGLAFVLDVWHSGEQTSMWSLFAGFSVWAWLLVVTQSVSGIFMGFVMKYSNNITRLFIISSAMLVTTILAVLIFSLRLNIYFACSFVLVSSSLYLYHR